MMCFFSPFSAGLCLARACANDECMCESAIESLVFDVSHIKRLQLLLPNQTQMRINTDNFAERRRERDDDEPKKTNTNISPPFFQHTKICG